MDAKVNARQSLDEITKEVNEMRSELNRNSEPNVDTVSDGDGGNQRAALGEIEKIKKIAEILESVVLPTIVDSKNAQTASQNKASAYGSASASSDPIKIVPKGLKLFQHHGSIGAPADDATQTAD